MGCVICVPHHRQLTKPAVTQESGCCTCASNLAFANLMELPKVMSVGAVAIDGLDIQTLVELYQGAPWCCISIPQQACTRTGPLNS
jgi:hypothetical protein